MSNGTSCTVVPVVVRHDGQGLRLAARSTTRTCWLLAAVEVTPATHPPPPRFDLSYQGGRNPSAGVWYATMPDANRWAASMAVWTWCPWRDTVEGNGSPPGPGEDNHVETGPRVVTADVPSADVEHEKQLAAEAAALLVGDGMVVGLGTGSTVAHLLPALARRRLSIRCVASSPRTEEAAVRLGLDVVAFGAVRLDIAVDGADQIAPDGWLVKGGGGAHTREKLLAVAADRFVVIADSTKPVDRLGPPVPLELLAFGFAATAARLGPVRRRDAPPSPDGGVLADYTGAFDDPGALAEVLDADPGVVSHGLFPPGLVTTIVVGRGASVERRPGGRD